jgi:hypothetical protein
MKTPDPDTAARMHAVAAALSAAGLTAQVHVTRGVLDVTATWEQADGKAPEVIVDLCRPRDYADIGGGLVVHALVRAGFGRVG